MKRCIMWALAGLLTLNGLACNQKSPPNDPKAPGNDVATVTIKMKTRGAGDVVAITNEDKKTIKMKFTDLKGKVLKDNTQDVSEVFEYEETMIKRDGTKPPEKLEREYAKWQLKEGDKTQDVMPKGKKIVVEKKDGKYIVTAKDGPLDPQAIMAVMKEFSRPEQTSEEDLQRLMLPTVPIRPGETWKIDMDKLAKEMSKEMEGAVFDTGKATGSGKLLKVYKKDDKQYGEMTIEFKLPITQLGAAGMAFNNERLSSFLQMEVRFDGCIDGTSEAGTMNKKATMKTESSAAGGPGGPPAGTRISMSMTGEATTTQRDVAKK